jgi:hypothetical protein
LAPEGDVEALEMDRRYFKYYDRKKEIYVDDEEFK